MGFWAIFFIIATILCFETGTADITVTVIFAALAIFFTYSWATQDTGHRRKKPSGKGGGSSGGDYSGSTHYGSGTPSSVHTSSGNTVDTYGFGWRESPTGGRIGPHNERVEKNVFGNWEYTDSDGDADDRATFEYD